MTIGKLRCEVADVKAAKFTKPILSHKAPSHLLILKDVISLHFKGSCHNVDKMGSELLRWCPLFYNMSLLSACGLRYLCKDFSRTPPGNLQAVQIRLICEE